MGKNKQDIPNLPGDPNFLLAQLLKKDTRAQKIFDPKAIEELSGKYIQSMGFSLKGELSITTALDTFEEQRITNSRDLKNPKITGGSLGEVLKKAETGDDPAVVAKRNVKGRLDTVFDRTEGFQSASNKFNELIAAINEKAGQLPPENLDPRLFAHLLEEEKGKMVKEMKAQFEHENNAIKALAKDADFKRDVIANLGVKDSEFDTFIRSIENDVKKGQSEQLKAFEKSMNNQISNLYRQATAEQTRVAYIARLVDENKKVRNFVEQQVGKAAVDQTLDPNAEESGAFLSIQLEKLADAHLLTTLSGREITYNKQENAYEYKFPSKWNLFYNYRKENMAQNDMRSIAEAVKATGNDSIVMTVKHTNPKNAEEMGRMAYEAARKAGFPPDKITIKLNTLDPASGKKNTSEATIKKLFEKHPKWKDRIEKEATNLENKWEPRASAMPPEKFTAMKQKVKELRESLVGPKPGPEAMPRV